MQPGSTATTTASPTGLPGKKRSPSSSSSDRTSPIASTSQWISPSCPASVIRRSKKLCPPPATPNRLGSCVMMMVSPAPALKPTRMLSLIRRTSMLSRKSQAIRQSSRHGKGRQARDLRIADRIARGQRADRARDHQRDRRGRADRKLTRGAEQRVADAAEHDSHRCRPAAAGRQAPHRPATPGSRRRQA